MKISLLFHAGNLFTDGKHPLTGEGLERVNKEASARKYADCLAAEVQDKFPDAEVKVDFDMDEVQENGLEILSPKLGDEDSDEIHEAVVEIDQEVYADIWGWMVEAT